MIATIFLLQGAYATRKWSDECTHVLADESCSLTPELLDAVIGKKQIVLGDWFKVLPLPMNILYAPLFFFSKKSMNCYFPCGWSYEN